VHVACNFNCCIEAEGHLKVTGSQVQCKCGNFSETVQDRDVVTSDHY